MNSADAPTLSEVKSLPLSLDCVARNLKQTLKSSCHSYVKRNADVIV